MAMPPPAIEITQHPQVPRSDTRLQIAGDPIDAVLVEGTLVAVGAQIQLQALALDAQPVGDVILNPYTPEVGLPGHRRRLVNSSHSSPTTHGSPVWRLAKDSSISPRVVIPVRRSSGPER